MATRRTLVLTWMISSFTVKHMNFVDAQPSLIIRTIQKVVG